MSPEGQIRTVDINAWVERARHDSQLYAERQATEVLLAAIGGSDTFGARMFLKGGVLMGVVYESPRHTVDIDFTADLTPTETLLGELRESLDEELVRAAARLGYPDTVFRVQSVKKKPRPQGFVHQKHPALELKIAYAKRGTRLHEHLLRGQCPQTLTVEMTFNEPVEAVEFVRTNESDGFKAYAFEELIAEKLRALLQQSKRDRARRQDIFDIAFLIRGGSVGEEEKQTILERLIKKSRIRDVEPHIDSFQDPELKSRAKREWATLELEVEALPDFEECFAAVAAFYQSLPWNREDGPAERKD